MCSLNQIPCSDLVQGQRPGSDRGCGADHSGRSHAAQVSAPVDVSPEPGP